VNLGFRLSSLLGEEFLSVPIHSPPLSGRLISPSVGIHTYYVSFIDDYNKYTWIYLIKKKSDVFKYFMTPVKWICRKET
jgi:hypothetical protein